MPLPNQPEHRKTYSAQDARGGEIILRTRTERLIFIGGLAAAMTLGVVVVIVGFWMQG
ncbi:MAG TPA: hypothetical protein VGG57_03070 [Stellaceae bacterium]|jgi:hypothetical protein